MKYLSFVFCVSLLFFISNVLASPYYTARTPVYVQGYYRSNGTYVSPYYRAQPRSNLYNMPIVRPRPGLVETFTSSFQRGLQIGQTMNRIQQTRLQNQLLAQKLKYIKQRTNHHENLNEVHLAMDYYQGMHGKKRAYKKAANLFLHAARSGIPFAQFIIGNLYSIGRGVSKNLVKSYAWLNLAILSDPRFNKYSYLRRSTYNKMSRKDRKKAEYLSYQLWKKYAAHRG